VEMDAESTNAVIDGMNNMEYGFNDLPQGRK
jgi:hypothetical protein